MSKAHILLAEDSRSIAQHIVRILSAQDFEVTVAEDGQAAWEILAGGAHFETIVLDREMPRMDGMELLRRIKTSPHLAQIPVVMETTRDDEESIREGLAEGAYYYLTKPFVPAVLLSVVTAALGQYREHLALQAGVRDAERPFEFLDSGTFRFRTLEDGRLLANSLARACPEPERSVMGLQELIVNAVEHGNLGIRYEEKTDLLMSGRWLEEVSRRLQTPDGLQRQVQVSFERRIQDIRITVQDEGAGFNWQKYVDFDAARAFDNHGRGIAMARTLSFDAVQYSGNGNTVTATLKRNP